VPLMIRETDFFQRGCPPEIRETLDMPWHFLGVVPANSAHRAHLALCTSCCNVNFQISPCRSPCKSDTTDPVVNLLPYHLLTDDLLQVLVYWGRCGGCGRVYWAQTGPPFRRSPRQ